MPRLIHWLSTHLVALTLAGFAWVGADLYDLRSLVADASSPRSAQPNVTPPRRSPGPDAGTVERAHPAAPMRGEDSRSATVQGPSPAAAVGPFRPPGETPPVSAESSREAILQRAREAYWRGDTEAAERAYMDLLAASPGDADAFGELANLYHATGRREEARDALYEAALRLQLVRDGRLRQVVEYLRQEQDPRAELFDR